MSYSLHNVLSELLELSSVSDVNSFLKRLYFRSDIPIMDFILINRIAVLHKCDMSRDGVTVSTSASEAEDGDSISSPATI